MRKIRTKKMCLRTSQESGGCERRKVEVSVHRSLNGLLSR